METVGVEASVDPPGWAGEEYSLQASLQALGSFFQFGRHCVKFLKMDALLLDKMFVCFSLFIIFDSF